MSFVDEDYIPESGALFNFGEIGCEELLSKIWIKNDPIKEMCCGDEFVVLITFSGRVFSYGKNDWGQLGLGHTRMENNPCCIKWLRSANEKAEHVACGRCHTLISTENQKLFGCGSNSDGQLGIDMATASVMEPTEIVSWQGGPIQKLAAGGEFSAALTDAGDLYVWGSNSESQLGLNLTDDKGLWEPTKLKFFPSPVTAICCGSYHMGAITVGTLYMWGEVSDGKLGLGDNVQSNQSFPQKVPLNSPAKEVTCGNNHTVCLTSSGDVYVWGHGESGQIGLGPSEVFVSKPTLLKLPSKLVNAFGDNGRLMEKFVKVSAGERHTAIINASGLVFTFGDGRHGKLGNFGGSNSYSNRMWPTIIEKLSNDMWADDVVCGGCHTIVLIRPRHTEEQIDGLKSTYLFSTLQTNNDSGRMDGTPINSRRHRRHNMNKENNDDDSNLPTLKSSTSTLATIDAQRKRKDSFPHVEEQIADVRNKALESTASGTIGSEVASTDVEELERVKAEMNKYVNKANQPSSSPNRKESFEEKVDKFSGLMDDVYGDSAATGMESSDEIIRKRPRKKRKIKAMQAKDESSIEFGHPVSNNIVSSDKQANDEDLDTKGYVKPKGREEIPNDTAHPEVAKVGCQANCKGKQESGTCTVI